jgi:regulator of protease activity HflC (stomatin/prohibitin superfamily)
MANERVIRGISGWVVVGIAAVVAAGAVWTLANNPNDIQIMLTMAVIVVTAGCLMGLTVVNPNEASVVTLFGVYKGTIKHSGFWWVNPLTSRRKLSLRVRNFESTKLKVNERDGNPIEIAAVVVWRVTDTGQALFDVDAYQSFIDIQIETAVREIASHFAYDHAEHEEPTLRGDADQVSTLLKEKLQERVAVAGVVIDETKLSHLAYAPEIASAMLRRQQAEAVLAARRYIVQGAVEMVQHALEQLSARDIVQLDDERRAAMVSNLLVVLCGDRDAQPVVNTGSLYQ